jgi:hypothetical protein
MEEPRAAESEGTSASPPALHWAFVGCATFIWIVIVVAIGLYRSAWMDELFMTVVTDPAEPLASLVEQWRAEPHPPTYSVALWAWRHIVDIHHIFALRAFGVAISAACLLGALAYWRSVKWPGLGLFALLLLTSPPLLFFPQEARSYFLSAFGGVFAALYLLRAFERREPVPPTTTDVVVGVAAAALLGTHLMSLAFEFLLFGLAMLAMAAQRNWAWLKATLIIGVVVTGTILVVTILPIVGGVRDMAAGFWITRRIVLETALMLPLFVGVPVIAAMAWMALGWRGLVAWRERAAAGLIVAIMASVFMLGLGSIIKPLFLLRYLIAPAAALAPPAAIVLAHLLRARFGEGDILTPLRGAIALVAAFATGLGVVAYDLYTTSDWRSPGRTVESAATCAGATLPYLLLHRLPETTPWPRFYQWYAPHSEFTPATLSAVEAANQQACPVRLWIAHSSDGGTLPEEYVASVNRTCEGGERVGLRFSDGFLVVDADATELISSWRGDVIACSDIIVDARHAL